jgi:hypothetical protein
MCKGYITHICYSQVSRCMMYTTREHLLHKMFLDAWAGDTPALKKGPGLGIGNLVVCLDVVGVPVRSEPGSRR